MAVSIAFIPLYPNANISAADIQADLVAKWPDLASPHLVKENEDSLAFRVGNSNVIIAFMPVPIPWSDLEGPCETSWLWKDAKAALRGHTGHLIVTVVSEEEPVERSRLLTQFCASILATCEQAPGVYWPSAALLVPSALFQDMAVEVMPEEPPLLIWVDFRVGWSDQGKSSGFTTGMAGLGHMELEAEDAPEPPNELQQRLMSVVYYLLDNGPVIQDGDTIGGEDEGPIRVVYADSAFGHKGKVMRLEYGSWTPR